MNLLGLVLLAPAQNTWCFALAYAVIGIGRALDSGPLEGWFVDALHDAEPGADPVRGLSRAGAPVLGQSLVAPFVAAAGCTALGLVAVAVLVVPVGPVRTASGPCEALPAARPTCPAS